MNGYIAHVSDDGRVQYVKEHLENTAEKAGEFASAFGAREVGYTAGLLHDIGKYSEAFQARIRGSQIQVDHSTAGAQIAGSHNLIPIAFAVAGHHSGIPDGGSVLDMAQDPTLFGRMKKQTEDFSAWEKEINLPDTDFPDWFCRSDNFSQSFFTRMIYSCLVDADFLDTETFMQGKQARGGYENISSLLDKLRNFTDGWLDSSNVSEINSVRNTILRNCIECGRKWPRGLYTLTVPTGGGKTISSLSFALEQASALEMDRVIYVIPYTSIIDQTAQVFQNILGEDSVLAHYSESDFFLKDREDLSSSEYRRLLASENWDAPVIITTAVQFFESLFSNRSSRCRKLHNMTNSVIIFDEAQTLPLKYLRPCIAVISELVTHYRATAVLCTATQPAFGNLFQEYNLKAEEICPDQKKVFQVLRRTALKDLGSISKKDLAEKLQENTQVLCVVNRRKTAQEIYSEMPEEGRFCLTTLLCAADRKKKLETIRRRLKEGLPCRVISTSLIEAGVDVDFPVAYREEAGLDSFLQTAGRCNREMKNPDPDKCPVYLFSLEENKPLTALGQQVAALRYVQRTSSVLDQPETIEKYFKTLFYKIKEGDDLDQKGILKALQKGVNGNCFPYEYVSGEFHIIEEPTRTVYIPIGEGKELCEKLRSGERSRILFRRLGPYSVSVYEKQFEELMYAGVLDIAEERSAILIDMSQYNINTGLNTEAPGGQAFLIDI